MKYVQMFRFSFQLFVLALLVGCSAMQPKIQNEADLNLQTFDLMSKFFCKEKRWPTSFAEFSDFVGKGKSESLLSYYGEPLLKTDRLIVTSLYYTPTKKLAVSDTLDKRSISFIAPPSCGEPQLSPNTQDILGGTLKFFVPDGFVSLTAVEMQDRWGKGPYPDAAWKDGTGEILIAIRFGEAKLARSAITEFKEPLQIAYENSTPDIKWISKNIVDTVDRSWISFVFESNSKKGRLFNHVVSTSFRGYLFSLSVFGPVERSNEVEGASGATMEGTQFPIPKV